MKFAIAIPARYGSTRFPGKPLAKIAGKTMLERVLHVAKIAAEPYDASIFVATDDQRIRDHATELGEMCFMTPSGCPTGSDRVLSAIRQLNNWPEFIVNLQGDAPFTPPSIIQNLFQAFEENNHLEVITPVHRLSWHDLDRLRAKKKTTPFSGTTAIIDENERALWFSKTIIPSIRKEEELRREMDFSPIHQHIGLYGFRSDVLEQFCRLSEGTYEALEGLEQLRMLENGIKIQTVSMDIEKGMIQSGIDSPEDIARAEAHITQYGEPLV
ncbi:MAG: 3-deoxy-manno-octulosonate cytidylyltransferase [Alphaproteobacteria bacterium]